MTSCALEMPALPERNENHIQLLGRCQSGRLYSNFFHVGGHGPVVDLAEDQTNIE